MTKKEKTVSVEIISRESMEYVNQYVQNSRFLMVKSVFVLLGISGLMEIAENVNKMKFMILKKRFVYQNVDQIKSITKKHVNVNVKKGIIG